MAKSLKKAKPKSSETHGDSGEQEEEHKTAEMFPRGDYCSACGRECKLKRCRYCGEYFCKEHIDPKTPLELHPGATDEENERLKRGYDELGGHSCASYSDHRKGKRKKKAKKTVVTKPTVHEKKEPKALPERKPEMKEEPGTGFSAHRRLFLVLFLLILIPLALLFFKPWEFLPSNKPAQENHTDLPFERPVFDVADIEKQVHEAVNEERTANGLSPLKWNDEIAGVARKHSRYLASLQTNYGEKAVLYASHEGRNSEMPTDRLESTGIEYDLSGENVFAGSIIKETYQGGASGEIKNVYYSMGELVRNVVNEWMGNDTYKETILNNSFTETGIGISVDPTHSNYFFTQDFIQAFYCGYLTGPCCEESPLCTGWLECKEGVCREPLKTEHVALEIEKGFYMRGDDAIRVSLDLTAPSGSGDYLYQLNFLRKQKSVFQKSSCSATGSCVIQLTGHVYPIQFITEEKSFDQVCVEFKKVDVAGDTFSILSNTTECIGTPEFCSYC